MSRVQCGPAGELPDDAVSQTHWKPRPELDIDLNPDYPSPGNSEYGGRPVGGRLRADEDCAVES